MYTHILYTYIHISNIYIYINKACVQFWNCRFDFPSPGALLAKQTHFDCTRRWQRYRSPKDVAVAIEFSDQIKPQAETETVTVAKNCRYFADVDTVAPFSPFSGRNSGRTSQNDYFSRKLPLHQAPQFLAIKIQIERTFTWDPFIDRLNLAESGLEMIVKSGNKRAHFFPNSALHWALAPIRVADGFSPEQVDHQTDPEFGSKKWQ